MKKVWIYSMVLLLACNPSQKKDQQNWDLEMLTRDVKEETQRTWEAYKKYAWGQDNLLPLSGGYSNWYSESLSISPIDAYSTLKIMGFEDHAKEIESFVIDSLDFNKDLFVKTFEVNIRILGGLLSMYSMSGDQRILGKAEDFARRMIPAFGSASGIPHYWVNLKTGEVRGDTVNVAEGGSCLLEMGILSCFTGNPEYYQAAKKASQSIFNARSELGLISEIIDVESGKTINQFGHVGCCIDSYFEYLYKGWILFRDPDLKSMWDQSIGPIQQYLAEESDTSLWYGKADVNTGELVSSVVTLYDAYFPGLLALSGDLENASKAQLSWDRLWKMHGLEPMVYDYRSGELKDPRYYLNPEIIESAWYLYHYTGENQYLDMLRTYYSNVKEYCRTGIAYAHIADVVTKEQSNAMSTFFLAETMKYFYLAFNEEAGIDPDSHVFSTEAHVFRKADFTDEKLEVGLGIKVARKTFKLAMVQMLVEGGDLEGNLERASERISEAAKQGADIALLPEAMDLGWTHTSAKTMAFPVPGGKTFKSLAGAARKNSVFVVAGIIEKEGDRTYNTAVLINPDGELLLKHRKLNELDIAHDLYDLGDRLNVCRTDLGTIGLMICADATAKDLALQRSIGYMGADIILSPSAWAVPPDHDNLADPYGELWRSCYKPVAEEFKMWIVGVSNVGLVSEGPWKDWYCIGCSLAIDAEGNEVLQAPYGKEADTIMYINISPYPRPARGTSWNQYWGRE